MDERELMRELLAELRRLRRDGIVARLSEAEREEIALRVFERVDERLAPAEQQTEDEAPRGGKRASRYFRGKG